MSVITRERAHSAPLKSETKLLMQAIQQFYSERPVVRLSVNYDILARYILQAGGYMETDVLVTFSWLQHAIERCIGYQNGPFDEALHTLAGQSPDDTSVRQVEIGCMVSIYSLIIRDYLPSPELRGSIYQMLYSLDGNSLTDHILKSLNTTDSQLLHDQLERIQ